MIVSREEFEREMPQEYLDLMAEVLEGGLTDYNDDSMYSPAARRDHTPSARAMIRNCHIAARARRATTDFGELRLVVRRGRLLFVVKDRFVVAFKKLDRRYRPLNNPTRQSRAYLAQAWPTTRGIQQALPGMEAAQTPTNIVVGYRFTNPAETEFELLVTCPDGRVNAWVMELLPATPNVTPLAAPAPEGTPAPRRRRVQIRTDVAKEEDGQQSAS